jgi:hypothetical protein
LEGKQRKWKELTAVPYIAYLLQLLGVLFFCCCLGLAGSLSSSGKTKKTYTSDKIGQTGSLSIYSVSIAETTKANER